MNGKIEKILNRGFLVIVYSVFIGLLLFAYFSFFDGTNSIKFNNEVFPTDKAIYAPGDNVFIQVDICRTRRMPGEVTFLLVNEFNIELPTQKVITEKGCEIFWNNVGKIPEFTPNGTYSIRGEARYRINALRQISYSFNSVEFQIKTN